MRSASCAVTSPRQPVRQAGRVAAAASATCLRTEPAFATNASGASRLGAMYSARVVWQRPVLVFRGVLLTEATSFCYLFEAGVLIDYRSMDIDGRILLPQGEEVRHRRTCCVVRYQATECSVSVENYNFILQLYRPKCVKVSDPYIPSSGVIYNTRPFWRSSDRDIGYGTIPAKVIFR